MRVNAELPKLGAIKREPESYTAARRYVARYLEWFPSQPLAGQRIGLYQHSAAGWGLNHQVLVALGAEVVVLGRSEQLVPVDTEAVSDGPHQGQRLGRPASAGCVADDRW